MGYVASKGNAILAIMYDETSQSPRVDNDNLGNMFCWHSRYNLGDEHDYDHHYDFLEMLICENESSEKIIDFAKKSYSTDFKYDKEEQGYIIFDRASKNGDYHKYDFVDGEKGQVDDDLAYALLDAMMPNELMELASQTNLILPVHLYDHSGLTMNTTGFSCNWDSGQIGYIFVSHKDIEELYGDLSAESIEKARNCLLAEVKEFDCYLRGENYGFRLLQDGQEVDSCWGFLGEIEDIKECIASHLPDEFKDMVNELEYVDESKLVLEVERADVEVCR